jgi:TldD protein
LESLDLKPYTALFNNYTELRIQENSFAVITLNNGNLVQNARKITGGASARVYGSGSWGFASCQDISSEGIGKVLTEAGENASFLASRCGYAHKPFPESSVRISRSHATTRPVRTQKELVGFVREIDGYITEKYKGLTNRFVTLSAFNTHKKLVTSQGSEAESLVPRTTLVIQLSTEKESQPVEVYDFLGGLGQFEDLFLSPEPVYEMIDEVYRHLINKRDGVFARAGLAECVLGPSLAGILAHEAIGHTTEADLVLGGSVAGEHVDELVASELVTLTDFAHTALGQTCPVPVYADDEGVEARDTILIDRGILKGFMHNRESAEHFQVPPTGNARASEFSDEPLIRMRNTAILPGNDKLEEMIASVEEGYYLIKSSNGQADSTSEFMFGVPLGYEIKKGKLGRAIKDTTISGVAFDMLKTVTMLSDDMCWDGSAWCGKKQTIQVGMGGPAIKCHVTLGGR